MLVREFDKRTSFFEACYAENTIKEGYVVWKNGLKLSKAS